MKKILNLVFVFVISTAVKAQYANTSWKNVYNIPGATDMVLQFKQDTLLLNYFEDGSNAEMMKYKINGDTLVLSKISGISPCGDEKGYYKISIKDDKLLMNLIQDSCYERANAMPTAPYGKL